VSAAINPIIDSNGNIPPAVLAGIETLVGGGIAGALGYNVQGPPSLLRPASRGYFATTHCSFASSLAYGSNFPPRTITAI